MCIYIDMHPGPGRHRQHGPRGVQLEGLGGKGVTGKPWDKILEENQDLEEASLLRETSAVPQHMATSQLRFPTAKEHTCAGQRMLQTGFHSLSSFSSPAEHKATSPWDSHTALLGCGPALKGLLANANNGDRRKESKMAFAAHPPCQFSARV